MEDLFINELNPSQREAVLYNDGPSLIIAGAGSGKTRVLTYKIAHLMKMGMMPYNILALTFTNKAAREMNHRIAQLIGDDFTRGLWSGTFHSIFSRILRIDGQVMGYTSDFTIYDTADSRSLIKTIIKEMKLDEKVYKPATIAGRISEAKNHLMLPEAYASDRSILDRDHFNNIGKTYDIYAKYFQRCRMANAMDFDDLLLNTYLLFSQYPEIRQKYAERFQYILVDEYQDTNHAQHAIISQLTKPSSRICVVGDDAQSIYGFRGANIDNILLFTQQYPKAKLIKLEQNYRSTQTIVNAANSIISHNQKQINKKVYSNNEEGSPIQVFSSYSDKDESLKIASEIKRLHRDDVDYKDIALLYRTNSQSRSFEETFRQANIPYRIYGGLSFFQRKEIKDILAYFRLVNNPHDEEAFKRVLNYPARGIGATTQGKLQLAAGEYNASLWEVLVNPEQYDLNFNKGTQAKLDKFKELILSFRSQLFTTEGYALAATIIRQTGIGAEINADNSPENLNRKENVEELLNAIKAYEEEVQEERGMEIVPLTEYLSQVSLLTDAEEKEDDSPKVTLMTIHAAKGLEFDTVFVTGMERDLFPNANANFYPKEMEEERRLFYVAVTRAKKRCYLTYAKSRFKYGNVEFCEPSPFLDEVDPQYLVRDDEDFNGFRSKPTPTASRSQSSSWPSRPTPPASNGRRLIPLKGMSSMGNSGNINLPKLKAGQRIEHDRFGLGTVISVEGNGDNTKACVEFDHAGRKNLLLKFAKIKTVL